MRHHPIRSLALTLAAMGMLVALAGCESKLTLANYQQVQPGMSVRQVEELLGSGTLEDKATGSNIGADGLGRRATQSDVDVYVWEGEHGVKVVVEFIDNKVVTTRQTGL